MALRRITVGHRALHRISGRLLALFSLSACVGLQTATQHFANLCEHDPALGPHLYGEFYAPWRFFQWTYRWAAGPFKPFFEEAQALGCLAFVVTFAVGLAFWQGPRITDKLHGSARWANLRDMYLAGLLGQNPQDSVVVGGIRGLPFGTWFLRHSGMENVLCYGPPRSGKGAGLVVPTLLTWGHSVFVTDLRGELFQLTSGYRYRTGQRVYRYAPGEPNSVSWNPLSEIRLNSEHTVADVQLVATLLVDPDGKGLQDHWQKTAQSLLVGLILYALLEDDRHPTLRRIDALLSDPEYSSNELWVTMTNSDHPLIAASGRDMLDRPPQEAGSVLSTAKSYLALYRDPVVAQNTTRSDFRLRDLMHHAKPHSLYLVTQPADKDRLRPLVRLMVSMAVRTLATDVGIQGGKPEANYRHRLLLMLDEFPALGSLPVLTESLAFLGGYGIKSYLICQDTVQLRSVYGPDETITAACHVQVAFPPNRTQTAQHLSELLGKTTVRYRAPSKNAQGSRTFTTHWAGRALLTPDECHSLPGPRKRRSGQITRAGHMLTIVAGHPPVYGLQPLYFKHRSLRIRAALPPLASPDSTRPCPSNL